MEIKAIIFDADNTLYKVRTEKAYEKLFNCIAKETNSDIKTVENIWRGHINNILNSDDARSAEKRKREYSIEIVLGQLGIPDKKQVLDITKKALDIFWQQIIDDLKYDAEYASVISRIMKKFRVSVASDEYRKNLEGKLNHVFGTWNNYFEFLISADDTGELKPSEKYSKMSLERFAMKPEEVVFIGDSWERDLAPAKVLGLKTILIADEKEGAPDFFATNLFEAEKILDSLVA